MWIPKVSLLFAAVSLTMFFDGELRCLRCDSKNGNIFGYVHSLMR